MKGRKFLCLNYHPVSKLIIAEANAKVNAFEFKYLDVQILNLMSNLLSTFQNLKQLFKIDFDFKKIKFMNGALRQ